MPCWQTTVVLAIVQQFLLGHGAIEDAQQVLGGDAMAGRSAR